VNWAPTPTGWRSGATAQAATSPRWYRCVRATRGTRLPALQLLFYPVTNYVDETRSQTLFADRLFLTKKDLDWCRKQFLDGAKVDAADPRVSPLYADDLSGLPPALVLTAGFDPLRDEGRQYAEAMRAAGVTVDYREFGSLVHGFANFFPGGWRQRDRRAESSLRCGPISPGHNSRRWGRRYS